jgi:hypothetical protein
MQISIIFEFYAVFRPLWMISPSTLNIMISSFNMNYLKIEVTSEKPEESVSIPQ